MDKKILLHELERLPAQERVDIAWSLLSSISDDKASLPVSFEQMKELGARLRHHYMNPDEPTVTLDQIRRKLFAG